MEDLKPCPFCGAEAQLREEQPVPTDDYYYRVRCRQCWATTDWNNKPDGAIEAWNRRVNK